MVFSASLPRPQFLMRHGAELSVWAWQLSPSQCRFCPSYHLSVVLAYLHPLSYNNNKTKHFKIILVVVKLQLLYVLLHPYSLTLLQDCFWVYAVSFNAVCSLVQFVCLKMINMRLTFSSWWPRWSAGAPPVSHPLWWSSESGTDSALSAPSPGLVAAVDQRSTAPASPAGVGVTPHCEHGK